jgi:hypothetical protein
MNICETRVPETAPGGICGPQVAGSKRGDAESRRERCISQALGWPLCRCSGYLIIGRVVAAHLGEAVMHRGTEVRGGALKAKTEPSRNRWSGGPSA